jgi:hypothetical protein
MIAWMSVSDGPTGTVSPGLYDTGLGPFGVSAIAASPKMPTGFTLATEFFGTFTSSFTRSTTSRKPSSRSVTSATAPTFTPASSTGCPGLRFCPHANRA